MQPTDRLSPHVAAVEFCAGSVVAKRANKWAERAPLLTGQALVEARRVCEVVEVIRGIVGKPIYLTSGIRPGSGSQHNAGQAADIQVWGMTPLELLALIWQHRERMPHRLRQVIAETVHGRDGLSAPMGDGLGGWVHVAILGARSYATAASKPWATHTASDGDSYPEWRPSNTIC